MLQLHRPLQLSNIIVPKVSRVVAKTPVIGPVIGLLIGLLIGPVIRFESTNIVLLINQMMLPHTIITSGALSFQEIIANRQRGLPVYSDGSGIWKIGQHGHRKIARELLPQIREVVRNAPLVAAHQRILTMDELAREASVAPREIAPSMLFQYSVILRHGAPLDLTGWNFRRCRKTQPITRTKPIHESHYSIRVSS